MSEQRHALMLEWEQWKGSHPQTDDVLIIGWKMDALFKN